jgi:thioesterase domain-containing protein
MPADLSTGQTGARPAAVADPQTWPVSSGQLGIWFVEQLTGGTSAHNLSFGLRLSGELDIAALELSLKLVTARHEALRTTFAVRDGRPVQLTHGTLPCAIETIDLMARSASEIEQQAYACALREADKPFDLTAGPLIRLVVITLSPEVHILLVIVHHIICDNWSLGLLARELSKSYEAFCKAAVPQLGPVTLQYVDYARWQNDWLRSGDFEHQLSYWVERLANASPLIAAAVDGTSPAGQLGGSSRAQRVPPELVGQLKVVAANHNATPFALSLTILQVLLCQHTGETDVLVGMPVAGRIAVEFEEVIGHFVNLVMLRSDLSGDPTITDLLRSARDTIIDALSNQDVPFERLVRALHPARDPAENPIFQVLFASVTAAAPWQRFGGLLASPYNVEALAVPFVLSVSIIEESAGTWWIRADYRTNLFTGDRITALLGHYLALLRAAVAQPQARLSQLNRALPWPVADPSRDQLVAENPEHAPRTWGSLPVAANTKNGRFARSLSDLPHDRVRAILQESWTRVLGAPSPDSAANFFDVGGHSLLAVRFVSEIGRKLGANFPVSFIFQQPTIEAMVNRIKAEASSTSSVLLLRQGGSRVPFFCGGARPEYQEFSGTLGSERPFFQLDVFALQEQRELADEPLYRSVADLAAAFREQIVSIQPVGPYFLGGICEGGIIVLEVALQLQRQGQPVALLAEFDTPVSGYWHRNLFHWAQFTHWLIVSGHLPMHVHSRLDRWKRRWFPESPEEERLLRIWRTIWKAIRQYRPHGRFDGEIQLFRAPNPWFTEDVTTGWAARASQGLRVHEVSGGHVAFFRDPPSQRVIAKVIEQAYSTAS